MHLCSPGQSILQLDTQASRPVVVFLNGEYWGIYTLQERYDEYYLQNHYGIAADHSVILRQERRPFSEEKQGMKTHYSEMLRYIRENSLQDPQHYKYIQTQMDVDNYIDYLIAEIYAGNDDWPDNNIYIWRMKTDQYEPNAPIGQDGRWRWMLFDLDFGFGLKGGAEDVQLRIRSRSRSKRGGVVSCSGLCWKTKNSDPHLRIASLIKLTRPTRLSG